MKIIEKVSDSMDWQKLNPFKRQQSDADDGKVASRKEDRKLAEHEIDEADDDETKKKYKRRLLLNRLRLDKHHKMERFAFSFLTISVLLVVTVSTGMLQSRSARVAEEESQIVLTSEAEFSLSGTTVQVGNMMKKTDGRTAYIPLFVSSFDQISPEADDYVVYYTDSSSDPDDLPEVNLHVLPNGNMLVLEVVSQTSDPLESVPIEFTIENNYPLLDSEGSLTEEEAIDEYDDPTFANRDMARLSVNPGSLAIESSNILNQPLSGHLLYYVLNVADEEYAIRQDLEDTIANFDYYIRQSERLQERIESLGFVAPALPDFITEDEFVVLDEEGQQEESTDVEEDGGAAEDEEESAENESVRQQFDTEEEDDFTFDDLYYYDWPILYEAGSRVSGGVLFDFQDNDLLEGYIGQLVDDPADLSDYLEARQEEVDADEDGVDYNDFLVDENGERHSTDDLMDGNITNENAVSALFELQGVWDDYLNDKLYLQQGLLPELLYLELDVLSQDIVYDVGDAEDISIPF